MSNHFRSVLIIDSALLFVLLLVTASEYAMVSPSLQAFYLWGRIAMVAATLLHMSLYRYFDRAWYGVWWAALLYVYSAHGEYCRPLYIISLFQIMVIHAFYFRHSRFSYVLTTSLGTAGFLIVMFMAWPDNVKRLGEANAGDQFTIAICSLITAMILYTQMERFRQKSIRITERLALVGSYATSLIHDLKNLSAAPLLYAGMLKNQGPAVFGPVVDQLNEDLRKMAFLVKELYGASKIGEVTHTSFELREVCELAREVVGTRMRNVPFKIDGDARITTDRTALQVIVLNLLYNAVPNRDVQPAVSIYIRDAELRFESEGASSPEIPSSPGLGLFLMGEMSRHAGIRLDYSQADSKWITTLRF